MTGGRRIKSVSIPERLLERVESIPNFTQYVISALENPDGRVSDAIERRATDRRAHMDDLDEMIQEFEIIMTNVRNIRRSPPHHRIPALDALVKSISETQAAWKDHREDIRRRS